MCRSSRTSDMRNDWREISVIVRIGAAGLLVGGDGKYAHRLWYALLQLMMQNCRQKKSTKNKAYSSRLLLLLLLLLMLMLLLL